MTGDPREITQTLGGRWSGRSGIAPCPVCQPERRRDQRALSIGSGSDGRLLLKCFKSGCEFTDILSSLYGSASFEVWRPSTELFAERKAEARAEEEKRRRQVKGLWSDTRPAEGSLVEAYLRRRAIRAPIPSSLRFHAACWHGNSARRLPAMVAAVERGTDVVAVHRTYLAEPGTKAAIDTNKAMLGPVSGGAVRRSAGDGPLIVAEGIETALSLLDAFSTERPRVWAALSASGMASMQLPPERAELVIAPDGDPAGRGGAEKLADRAYAAGWSVRIMEPPGAGIDWNDIAMREAAHECA